MKQVATWALGILSAAALSALLTACSTKVDFPGDNPAKDDITTQYGIYVKEFTDYDSIVVKLTVDGKPRTVPVILPGRMDGSWKIHWDFTADEGSHVVIVSDVWRHGAVVGRQYEEFFVGNVPKVNSPVRPPALTMPDTAYQWTMMTDSMPTSLTILAMAQSSMGDINGSILPIQDAAKLLRLQLDYTGDGVADTTAPGLAPADSFKFTGFRIPGLQDGMQRRVKAWVTDSMGRRVEDSCLVIATAGLRPDSTFIDPRDGGTYATRRIGAQTWFTQNLAYAAAGTVCSSLDPGCAKYGRYYNYATALTACPVGWHLPSKLEWTRLMGFIDLADNYRLDGDEANYMKSLTGYWSPMVPSLGGTTQFRFNANPAGFIDTIPGAVPSSSLMSAYFWTATPDTSNVNGVITVGNLAESLQLENWIGFNPRSKNYGYSVRCVRDE